VGATFVSAVEAAKAAGLARAVCGGRSKVCGGRSNCITTGHCGGKPPVASPERAAATAPGRATFVSEIEAAAAAGLAAVVTGVHE